MEALPNRIYAGFTLYYTLTDEDKLKREEIQGQSGPLSQSTQELPPVENRAPASQGGVENEPRLRQ